MAASGGDGSGGSHDVKPFAGQLVPAVGQRGPHRNGNDTAQQLCQAWLTIYRKQASKEDGLIAMYSKLFRMSLQVFQFYNWDLDLTMRAKLLEVMKRCHMALAARFTVLTLVYETLEKIVNHIPDPSLFLLKLREMDTLIQSVGKENIEERLKTIMETSAPLTQNLDVEMTGGNPPSRPIVSSSDHPVQKSEATEVKPKIEESPTNNKSSSPPKKSRKKSICNSPVREYDPLSCPVQPWLLQQEQVVPERPAMEEAVVGDEILQQLNAIYETALSTDTLSNFCKTIAELTCHRGVQLGWQCFRMPGGTPPCTEALISTFLVKDLMNDKSNSCCTRDLMVLWCRVLKHRQISPQEIARIASELVTRRSDSSGHFYLMFDVLLQECGASNHAALIDLMLRGMGVDLNGIEEAKLLNDNELRENIEINMGRMMLKMAGIFEDQPLVMRECVFSAFTIHPTKEALDILKGLSMTICDNNDPRCRCYGHRLDDLKEPLQAGRPSYEVLPGDEMFYFEPILDAVIPGVDFETLEDMVTILHAVRSPCFGLRDDWDTYFSEFYSSGRGSKYRTETRRTYQPMPVSHGTDGSEDSESDSDSSVGSSEYRRRYRRQQKEAALCVRNGKKAAGACHKLKTKEKNRPAAARRSVRQMQREKQQLLDDDKLDDMDDNGGVVSTIASSATLAAPSSGQANSVVIPQGSPQVILVAQQQPLQRMIGGGQKVVMNGPKVQVAAAAAAAAVSHVVVPQTTSMTPIAINTALSALQLPGQGQPTERETKSNPSVTTVSVGQPPRHLTSNGPLQSNNNVQSNVAGSTTTPGLNSPAFRVVLNRFDSLCGIALTPPSLRERPVRFQVNGGPIPKLPNVLIRNPRKLPAPPPTPGLNRVLGKANVPQLPSDPTRGKISSDLLRRLKDEVDNRCSSAPITQFFKHQQRKPIFTNKKEVPVKFNFRKQGPATTTAPGGQTPIPHTAKVNTLAVSVPSFNNSISQSVMVQSGIQQGASVGGGGGVKPEVKVEGGIQPRTVLAPPGPTISVVHQVRPQVHAQNLHHPHTTPRPSPVVVTTSPHPNLGIKSGANSNQVVRHLPQTPAPVTVTTMKDHQTNQQNVLMKILSSQPVPVNKVSETTSITTAATPVTIHNPPTAQTVHSPHISQTVVTTTTTQPSVMVSGASQVVNTMTAANADSLKLVQSVQQVLSGQRLGTPGGSGGQPLQYRVINTPGTPNATLGTMNQVSIQVPASPQGSNAQVTNQQGRIMTGRFVIPVNSLPSALAASVNGMPVIILKNQALGQQQIVPVQQVQPRGATGSLTASTVQTVQVVQRPATPSQTPPPQSPQTVHIKQGSGSNVSGTPPPMGAVVIKQQVGAHHHHHPHHLTAQVLKTGPKPSVVMSQPNQSGLNRLPIQVTVPVSATQGGTQIQIPSSRSVVVTNTNQPQQITVSQSSGTNFTLTQSQGGTFTTSGPSGTVGVINASSTLQQIPVSIAQGTQQVVHISSGGQAMTSQTIVVSQAGQRLVRVSPDVLQAAVKSGQTKIITYKPALQQPLAGGKAKVVAAEVIGTQDHQQQQQQPQQQPQPQQQQQQLQGQQQVQPQQLQNQQQGTIIAVQQPQQTKILTPQTVTQITTQAGGAPSHVVITTAAAAAAQQAQQQPQSQQQQQPQQQQQTHVIRVQNSVQVKRILPAVTLATTATTINNNNTIINTVATAAATPTTTTTTVVVNKGTIVAHVLKAPIAARQQSEKEKLKEITPVLDEDALMEQIMEAEVKEQMQAFKKSPFEHVKDDPPLIENGIVTASTAEGDEPPAKKRRRKSNEADDLRSVSDALKFAIMSETASIGDDELDAEITLENEMSVTLNLSSSEEDSDDNNDDHQNEADRNSRRIKRRRTSRSVILTESALQEHNKRTQQTAAQALIEAAAAKIMESANGMPQQPQYQHSKDQSSSSSGVIVSSDHVTHNGKSLSVQVVTGGIQRNSDDSVSDRNRLGFGGSPTVISLPDDDGQKMSMPMVKQMVMINPGSLKDSPNNTPTSTGGSTNASSLSNKKKGPYSATSKEEATALQSRYKCQECQRGFFSAYNLRRHMKNVHKIEMAPPSLPSATPPPPSSSTTPTSSQARRSDSSQLLAALNGGITSGTSLNDSDIEEGSSLDQFMVMSSTPKNALTALLEAPPVHSPNL